MSIRLAKAISWLFHPVWLGLLGTFVIFQNHTIIHSKLVNLNLEALWMLVFLSTAVLPVVSGMMITGIRDVRQLPALDDRGRRIFMLIAGLYQLLLLYMFVRGGMQYFVMPFYIGNAISLFVCAWISLYYRISLHALGWGAFCAMLIFLIPHSDSNFIYVLMGSVMLSGMVMSARLWLGAHDNKQVYLGFLTSMSIMSIIYFIYDYSF